MVKSFTFAATAVALGLVTAKAHAFSSNVIDPNGPAYAWGKAVGDIDGDGRQDFVVGGYDARRGGLYWYKNPSWKRETISAKARIGTDLQVVDLDRDGRQDIVAITYNSGRHGLTLYQRSGKGWSSRTLVYSIPLHDIEVVDLDRDGKLDLAARGQQGAGKALHLWRQVSLTQWSYTRLAVPTGGEGLLAVDLNRDGRLDLAVGKYWFANGSGPGRLAFARHTYNMAAPTNAYVAAGDLNGDGRVDLVTSPAEPAGRRYRTSWFQAPASPTATWAENVLENNVEAVVHFAGVADFNGDGRNDVATAMMQQGRNPRIKIYYNRGGKFGPPAIVANASSHSMKIINVNGRRALAGADWRMSPRTPVKLWR